MKTGTRAIRSSGAKLPVAAWELIWRLRAKWVGSKPLPAGPEREEALLKDMRELLGALK